MERIDIEVEERELARNPEKRERLRRTRAFEPPDRVPVIVVTNRWTALAARNRTAADYLRSGADNLREQILNAKWRIETVRDDSPVPERLEFQPDFGSLRGSQFDVRILWPADGPAVCRPLLTDPRQIDALEAPEPAGGLNARKEAWHREMLEALRGFEVRLNGRPMEVSVTVRHAVAPATSAFALAGQNLFLWMAEEPRRARRLLDIVTESELRCLRYFDRLAGRGAAHPVPQGGDTGEMLSAAMFREFLVPVYGRVWDAYPGPRMFHNCGRCGHLLEVFRDDLGITTFNGFGHCLDPRALAETMAGRVVLRGGPDPWLVHSGGWDDIVSAAEEYVRCLGRRGGFLLSIGGGAAPGTPPDHYRALVEAARRTGCPMRN